MNKIEIGYCVDCSYFVYADSYDEDRAYDDAIVYQKYGTCGTREMTDRPYIATSYGCTNWKEKKQEEKQHIEAEVQAKLIKRIEKIEVMIQNICDGNRELANVLQPILQKG